MQESLQSRYYNPTIGRFINADAFASTGQGILGNNMFAYCLNNPVNYTDPTGNCACTAARNSAKAPMYSFACNCCGGGSGGSAAAGGTTGGEVALALGYAVVSLIDRISTASTNIRSITKEERVNVYVDAKTGQEKQYQYWEAARVGNIVVVGAGLTFTEASARVAVGFGVMCANHDAVKWIIILNCYWNAVGPEIHGDEGYFWHYHPNRRSHTHIWYYGG